MPRNMSFRFTAGRIRNRTKTVTRRLGWKFLKPGDQVQPVFQAQGLKKGEKMQKLGPCVDIVSVRTEKLSDITLDDIKKEGFLDLDWFGFVRMFCSNNSCKADREIRRIEFKYPEEEN